jgi:3',5'-cyclic AMP phosphodiesterase CpdA
MFNRRISRRAALERLSAGSLLALGLWPGALRAGDSDRAGSFRFLVVNDTHYMTPECGRWLEGVMRQMKSHRGAEFCLVAGDLAEHGTPEELAGARDALKVLGLPAFVVIGNHDYFTPKAPTRWDRSQHQSVAPGDFRGGTATMLTREGRRAYEQLFPKRLNYWFEHRGWQFVGLDTSEGLRYENTKIQDTTLRWLDDHLPRVDKELPTVIFTHFPLGADVNYRPLNADALLDRFRPYNLQAVFCGHFHGFTERLWGETALTTNRCCSLKRNNHDGTKEKGYFLCEAKDGKISRQFVEYKGT